MGFIATFRYWLLPMLGLKPQQGFEPHNFVFHDVASVVVGTHSLLRISVTYESL